MSVSDNGTCDARRFVLIAGMPRSGTNLVRRIVGSHSEIAIPSAEFVFLEKYSWGAHR